MNRAETQILTDLNVVATAQPPEAFARASGNGLLHRRHDGVRDLEQALPRVRG